MSEVFTDIGMALFQVKNLAGEAVIFDAIHVGTLDPADRYDAATNSVGLVDPNPRILTTNIVLTGSGPNVDYAIAIDVPEALTGSEVGFFDDGTLVALWASASGDVFSKVADSQALLNFGYTYVNGTPGNLTITSAPYPIATLDEMRDGTRNDRLSTPEGVKASIDANIPTGVRTIHLSTRQPMDNEWEDDDIWIIHEA